MFPSASKSHATQSPEIYESNPRVSPHPVFDHFHLELYNQTGRLYPDWNNIPFQHICKGCRASLMSHRQRAISSAL